MAALASSHGSLVRPTHSDGAASPATRRGPGHVLVVRDQANPEGKGGPCRVPAVRVPQGSRATGPQVSPPGQVAAAASWAWTAGTPAVTPPFPRVQSSHSSWTGAPQQQEPVTSSPLPVAAAVDATDLKANGTTPTRKQFTGNASLPGRLPFVGTPTCPKAIGTSTKPAPQAMPRMRSTSPGVQRFVSAPPQGAVMATRCGSPTMAAAAVRSPRPAPSPQAAGLSAGPFLVPMAPRHCTPRR